MDDRHSEVSWQIRLIAFPYLAAGFALFLIELNKFISQESTSLEILVNCLLAYIILTIGIGLLRFSFTSWVIAKFLAACGFVAITLAIFLSMVSMFTDGKFMDDGFVVQWLALSALAGWFAWQGSVLKSATIKIRTLRTARRKDKRRSARQITLSSLLYAVFVTAGVLGILRSQEPTSGRTKVHTWQRGKEVRQYRIQPAKPFLGIRQPLRNVRLQTWGTTESKAVKESTQEPFYESDFLRWLESDPEEFSLDSLRRFVD